MIGAVVWGALALGSAATLALRRPWTLVPARRGTPPELWGSPLFREANMVVTACWTAWFVIAAGVSAVFPWWVSPTLAGLNPILAIVSQKAGPRYAAWRLSQGGTA